MPTIKDLSQPAHLSAHELKQGHVQRWDTISILWIDELKRYLVYDAARDRAQCYQSLDAARRAFDRLRK